MQNIKGFKLTAPVTEQQREIAAHGPASFLISEDGRDWYECQKTFQPNTLKFTFDDNGIISSFSIDVSTLWPVNLNVAEVADVPKGIFNDRQWVFDGEKITPRLYTKEEHIQIAEQGRIECMKIAEAVITPLVCAQKHGMATDKELQRLAAWEYYLIKLSHLDLSRTPEVDWPVEPSI